MGSFVATLMMETSTGHSQTVFSQEVAGHLPALPTPLQSLPDAQQDRTSGSKNFPALSGREVRGRVKSLLEHCVVLCISLFTQTCAELTFTWLRAEVEKMFEMTYFEKYLHYKIGRAHV